MGVIIKNNKIITFNNNIVLTKTASNVKFGYLYSYYAITNVHGLIPAGWHIPSASELSTLITWLTNNGYGYEGSGSDVAKSLCYASGWTDSGTPGTPGNDQPANNSSGLGIRASGCRLFTGEFSSMGDEGYLLNNTGYSARSLLYNSSSANNSVFAYWGFPVRLIRNNDTGWNGQKLIDIDWNIYDTRRIGNQIWTVQNLATKRYVDGTAIANITDNAAWTADTTGARAAYNNDENYVFV